jgi:hypothetical protein
MKARHAMLVALAAAFVLTSVAVAGPSAARQRVMITTQAGQTTSVSPFLLVTLQTGSLKGDSGKMIGDSSSSGRSVMREGQESSIQEGPVTLKGKRGTLVLRYRAEWVEAGSGYGVATSTWKVVRGTGQYAGITGGGRGASVWLDRTDDWSSRLEGFLTLP